MMNRKRRRGEIKNKLIDALEIHPAHTSLNVSRSRVLHQLHAAPDGVRFQQYLTLDEPFIYPVC